MSKLQVDTIVDKEDKSAPTFSKGVIVTGVTTASGGVIGNFANGLAIRAITTKKNTNTTIMIAVENGNVGRTRDGANLTAKAAITDNIKAIYNNDPSLPA